MPNRFWQTLSVIGLACLLSHETSSAFSLLGPFEPWMTGEIGYRSPSDIGGPVSIGYGYRWNLPVITYGFDSGFVAHFGPEGIAAVEAAISILNRLPPASRMVVSNYPPNSKALNATAAEQSLMDLKSMTLALLLEQMGLATPTRYVWTLRSRNTMSIGGQTFTNYVIVQRGFDPFTLNRTNAVNQTVFQYLLLESGPPLLADAVEFLVDPLASTSTAVADVDLKPGEFYTGLSQDDAGGLRYLLKRSAVRVERLPVPVKAVNESSFKNRAFRSGVDEIAFVRLRRRPNGAWRAITNVFVDVYRQHGVVMRQRLQRVIRKPDILFSARALLAEDSVSTNVARIVSNCGTPLVERSSTARWQNYSRLNFPEIQAGPGVIPPGAIITFATLSATNGSNAPCVRWGSFGAGEPLVLYPAHD